MKLENNYCIKSRFIYQIHDTLEKDNFSKLSVSHSWLYKLLRVIYIDAVLL